MNRLTAEMKAQALQFASSSVGVAATPAFHRSNNIRGSTAHRRIGDQIVHEFCEFGRKRMPYVFSGAMLLAGDGMVGSKR